MFNNKVGTATLTVVVSFCLGLAASVHADNFAAVNFDAASGQLVITMSYRGSNPNHRFSLKWGECQQTEGESLPTVAAEVLDDQFEDKAERDYQTTARLDLNDMPCRPAKVTLRTAPRFYYELVIPK